MCVCVCVCAYARVQYMYLCILSTHGNLLPEVFAQVLWVSNFPTDSVHTAMHTHRVQCTYITVAHLRMHFTHSPSMHMYWACNICTYVSCTVCSSFAIAGSLGSVRCLPQVYLLVMEPSLTPLLKAPLE